MNSPLWPERWAELSPLIDQLLELSDEERSLAIEAVTDPVLRQTLSDWFAADHAPGLLDRSPEQVAAVLAVSITDLTGSEPIGPYQLRQLIGEGGSGSVYLAERQHDGYTQRVALKLLRVGVRDPVEKARFQREQRILARLAHPNIARLLDAGISEDGVPWFAMEYIDGAPLLAWCNERQLDIRARITLYLKVCAAVEAAHRALIVHRDLKPANILVSRDGEPKLLDFGIAKLLDDSERGDDTRTALRRLTPAYAAPEQFDGRAITTATDVHALGVVLHELLCGLRPERLQDGSLRTPSRRLHTHPEKTRLASQRQSTLRNLNDTLNGDLDVVLETALAPEPTARYASVAALVEDLNRHLSHRPLRARRASWTYRASRYIRRHRVALAITALLLLSIALGGIATFRQTERARQAALEAQQQAIRADAIRGLMLDLFSGISPDESRGREISAKELLQRGETRLLESLTTAPALSSDLLLALSAAWRQLGALEHARELTLKALDAAQTEDTRTAAQLERGRILRELGQLTEAEQAFRAALRSESVETRSQARSQLAEMLAERGDKPAALSLLKEADQETPITDRMLRLRNDIALGTVRFMGGDVEGAEQQLRNALADAEDGLPPEHTEIARILNDLGVVRLQRGDAAEAAALFERALAIRLKLLGEHHPDVARSQFELAGAMQRLGQAAKAKSLFESALALQRELLGPTHPDVARSLNSLAVVAQLLGDLRGAMTGMREALQVARAAFGDQHPTVAAILGNLAVIERALGELDIAETHQREALSMTLALSGESHFQSGVSRASLAMLLSEKGDLQAARREFETALQVIEAKVGPDHPDMALWRAAYADVLFDLGEVEAARDNADTARRISEQALNVADPRRGRIGLSQLRMRVLQGDCSEVDAEAASIGEQLARGGAAMRADRASLALLQAECARVTRASPDPFLQTASQELEQLDYHPRRLRLLQQRWLGRLAQ